MVELLNIPNLDKANSTSIIKDVYAENIIKREKRAFKNRLKNFTKIKNYVKIPAVGQRKTPEFQKNEISKN